MGEGKVRAPEAKATGTGGISKAVLEVALLAQLGTQLLTKVINRHGFPVTAEMPICPPVARRCAFKFRPYLVDRPFGVQSDKRAIGANFCTMAAITAVQFLTRPQQAPLDQLTEGNTRF